MTEEYPKNAEFHKYARRPFFVKAVQITPDNIHELAKMVGAVQHKADGTPYILVDSTKVPNMERVWCGSWLTELDGNIRCYTDRVFKFQFEKVIAS